MFRKICQCFNCLGNALAVNRICSIVVIFGSSAFFKEIFLKKCKTILKVVVIISITRDVDISLQTIQIIAGMKIVYPVVLGILTIIPATIRQLPCATIFHCLLGDRKSVV